MRVCMTYVESIEPKRWQKFVLRLYLVSGTLPVETPIAVRSRERVMRCRWRCGRLLPKSNHLPWKPFVCLRRSSERLVLLWNRCSYRGAKGRFGTLARRRVQRVVIPCVRRAWRLSCAGVIQPWPGPADLGDYGKSRVSQLQSRCSRAAKYAPSKGRKLPLFHDTNLRCHTPSLTNR